MGRWLGCLVCACFLIATAPVQAATITLFGDRAGFSAATGPLQTEEFEGSAVDVFFDTAPLAFAGFSVQAPDGPVFTRAGDRRNKLDVPQVRPRSLSLDGSAFLNILLQRDDRFVIRFDQPVFGFGADFAQFNEVARVLITLDGGPAITPTAVPGRRFLGIVSDTAFSEVTFRAVRADNFGIDGFSFAPTRVPLPGAGTMLLAALGGLWALRRRRVA